MIVFKPPKSVKRAVSPVQAQPVSSANKISLNQASVDQLQQLQGVGFKKGTGNCGLSPETRAI